MTRTANDAPAGTRSAVGWTVASRVSGLVRLAIGAAVLGPTFLGNVFLTVNTIPNLVYGLLGGALIAGLVVPAIVGHLDAGHDERASEIVASFLALLLASAALLAVVLLATAGLAASVLTAGVPAAIAGDARRAVVVLLVVVVPQVAGYAVTGVAAAAQNARGRYGLAAGGFVVENVGVSLGLLLVARHWGAGRDVGATGDGMLVALGLVGTLPVVAHAALQWWGAARCGVRLRLRAGVRHALRDAEVRALVRLAVPSMAIAGLFSLRLLAAAIVSGTVAGGWVALQLALACAILPSGLVGRPLGATLLRPVTRLLDVGDGDAARREYRRTAAMGIMVALPAAVGLAMLAMPLADVLAVGRMGTATVLLTWSLLSLAPGIVGDTLFEISKSVPLAARRAGAILSPTVLRVGITIAALAACAPFDGAARLAAVGAALSLGDATGAWWLHRRALAVTGDPRRGLRATLTGLGLARALPAAGFMAVASIAVIAACDHLGLDGPPSVVVTGGCGLAAYAAYHWWSRSPELARWIGRPVGRARRRTRMRRRAHRPPTVPLMIAASVAVAGSAIVALAVVGPVLVAAGAVAAGVLAVTAARPAVGAYVYLGAMPFLAGIDRGRFFPVLRPTEALQLVVTAGALAAAARAAWRRALPPLRLTRLDTCLVVLASSASVLPVARLLLAGEVPSGGDVLACVPLWKYAALYLLFRSTIRSAAEVTVACATSLVAACAVALIAVLQTLDLLGVRAILATLWVPNGDLDDLSLGRGTATFAGAIPTAAYLTFNLGLAVALLLRATGRRRTRLAVAAAALAVGVVGTAQFSGMLGALVVVVIVSATSGRVRRLLGAAVVVAPLAALAMAPALMARAAETGEGGLPVSWLVRFYNLRTYYWPQLADGGWLLGNRPNTIIVAPERWREVIFVESGHTWLLVVGGLPLLAAFVAFVAVAARSLREAARLDDAAWAPVARAALAAVGSLFVLMVLDTHLTMRGGADMIFALVGMALARYGARYLPWPERRAEVMA